MELDELRDLVADAEGEVRIAEARVTALDTSDEPDTSPDSVSVVEQGASARRKLARLRRQLAEAETRATEPTGDSAPARTFEFDSAEDWLTEFGLPLWRRPSTIWCRSWWEHREALLRVETMWRTWEVSRWEGPLALSAWLRDHYDHMTVLTNPSGTFKSCDWTSARHQLQTIVEVDPSPPAVWELRLKALTTDLTTGEIS